MNTPPSDPSAGELLADLALGRADALRTLVARHQAPLLRHARALAAVDRLLAEDAVQEAFLKLLERPPTLPDSTRGDAAAEHAYLAAWLHKVTRNACTDLLRSEARRKRREGERAASEAEARRHDEPVHDDTRAAVERGLERLSPEQREVLALRLFAERSYAEIAAITGKKLGTIGWLVSTGLRALSRELEPLLGIETKGAASTGGAAPIAAPLTSAAMSAIPTSGSRAQSLPGHVSDTGIRASSAAAPIAQPGPQARYGGQAS